MAITTYDELKTAVANWLDRDDLTAVIPDFISNAENDMNRKLRHYQMVERVDATLDSRYIQVPADWLQTLRFSITSGETYRLELITTDDMLDYRERNSDTPGRPRFYAHIGNSLEVFPTPDAEYTMQLAYYAKIPALSDSTTFNWLLQDSPDVYLYGALVHAAPYLKDDERLAVWTTLYNNALQTLQLSSDNNRFAGSGLRVRVTSY